MQQRIDSGFVDINTGTIENSYTTQALSGKYLCGFCRRNSGSLHWCYSSGKWKTPGGRIVPFCETKSGISASFFLADGRKKTFSEDPLARLSTELTEENLKYEHWDLESIFQEEDGLPVFRKEIFEASAPEDGWQAIGNRDELLAFAGGVNSGNVLCRQGKYFLTADINLSGTEWTPVGKNEAVSFCGSFDGCGHTVSGFRVKGDGLDYAGFFGVCTGAHIQRLIVDGTISGGDTVGGFASVLDKTNVSCCGAAVLIRNGRKTAGFVGNNNGKISRCFAAGESRGKPFFLIPLIFISSIVLAAAAIAAVIQINKVNPVNNVIFNPVPTDSYAVAADTPDSVDSQPAESSPSTLHSVSVSIGEKVLADTGTSLATALISNPSSDSNQYMTASLRITDQELIDKIGKTGRTADSQAEAEADSGYDPTVSAVTVGQTGAIHPGEKVEKLQLEALPDGTVLPAGTYKAYLFFEFYSTETDTKADVNNQAAVELVISG